MDALEDEVAVVVVEDRLGSETRSAPGRPATCSRMSTSKTAAHRSRMICRTEVAPAPRARPTISPALISSAASSQRCRSSAVGPVGLARSRNALAMLA
jgi:hypothetical protein